jgi:hypothetical protein
LESVRTSIKSKHVFLRNGMAKTLVLQSVLLDLRLQGTERIALL